MLRVFPLCVCLLLAGCGSEKAAMGPLDRSWHDGTVTVSPYREGTEMGIKVRGKWPNASEGLWIRHALRLTQDKIDALLVGTANTLESFQLVGTGVRDYSKDSLRGLDKTKPHRAVFDYEIWQGRPGEGRLLTKQSVFSEEIAGK